MLSFPPTSSMMEATKAESETATTEFEELLEQVLRILEERQGLTIDRGR